MIDRRIDDIYRILNWWDSIRPRPVKDERILCPCNHAREEQIGETENFIMISDIPIPMADAK
jgi:hypothetical protein